MRNMSFMLTTGQVRGRVKSVTRRLGWRKLRVGEFVRACVKCMGIRKGGRVERICVIRVTGVRFERLDRLLAEPDYGARECAAEGFPDMAPADFVGMFCKTHDGCMAESVVTRIEFEYVDFDPEMEVRRG